MPDPSCAQSSSPRPRRFIGAWLWTVAALALCGLPILDGLLLPWPGLPEMRWLGEIWHIKRRLAEQAPPGARLLIVSGSSGLFSLDGELLSARLGLPVLNLGTHAGLNLRMLLENAREVARPGDYLLLYLEDAHYGNAVSKVTDLERKALWTLWPTRLAHLPWAALGEQLYGNPVADYRDGWLRRDEAMRGDGLARWSENFYSGLELSPAGDYRGRTSPPAAPLQSPKLAPLREVRRDSREELERFLAWCGAHGIHPLAALPAVLRSAPEGGQEEDRSTSAVRAFYASRQVSFLENGKADRLPAELLLDTAYHASTAGRRVVTEAMAGPLAGALGRPAAPSRPECLLVAASRAVLGRELVLAREGPSSCRFLSPQDLHSPLALQPAEVRAAVGRGERFVFADPEVESLLAAEGLRSTVLEEKRSRLGDWIAEFPRHLFLLAARGALPAFSEAAALPEPFRSFLTAEMPSRSAMIGTGPLATIDLQKLAAGSLSVRLPDLAPAQFHLPCAVGITVQSGNPAAPSMVVDGLSLAEETEAGLHVAVLDPTTGRLVKHAVFAEDTLLEWQLREVVPELR